MRVFLIRRQSRIPLSRPVRAHIRLWNALARFLDGARQYNIVFLASWSKRKPCIRSAKVATPRIRPATILYYNTMENSDSRYGREAININHLTLSHSLAHMYLQLP
eukprot:scaffold16003_cov149-Amphora_coffeaeformis.AAC.2